MNYNTESKVEQYFQQSDLLHTHNSKLRRIPSITVDNYVTLGQLTALRFLEWVSLNPGGVIALPTGRTPEFFIKWTQYYLLNWKREQQSGLLAKIGLSQLPYPDMKSLTFFQLDEFFPISPDHERSFTYFVKEFYIKGFGLDPEKVHLIDTYNLTATQKAALGPFNKLDEIFPNGQIDLSLRIKKPSSPQDRLKKKAIKLFDSFCANYEEKIRQLGGIGFFLGGIGPDGHIAFNVKGTSHFSCTRLTDINYETQAAAATDLGGIELVRQKAVITIGLETIAYNPNVVALIIAAGESKAKIVAQAIENEPDVDFPAGSLQRLSNARFFLTKSSAIRLKRSEKSILNLAQSGNLEANMAEKLLINEALQNNVSLIEIADGKCPEAIRQRLRTTEKISGQSIEKQAENIHLSIREKVENGINIPGNQRIMHTAPHHDDIELAYFPLLHHLVRSITNDNQFVYCTSGFTAVTNFYVIDRLEQLQDLIATGQLLREADLSRLMKGNRLQDDITNYLNGIASQNTSQQDMAIACRLTRLFFNHLNTNKLEEVADFVNTQLARLKTLEAGRQLPKIIQHIKGWLREFEAELVWAHFGIGSEKVKHLRLHFYTADIFPQYPDRELDVQPILNLLEDNKPTIITLALDPEGSGPDTHYKTLIALAEAIDLYKARYPDMNIRIWGYRNVWSRFHIADVSTIVPVSLNSFAVLHNMFNSCFLSQKSASFPSHELDGTFSELAQKIWVEQHSKLVKLLGKSYFYDNPNPLMRRSYGAIFIKDMSYKEFSDEIKSVRRLLKAKDEMDTSKNK